MRLGEMWMKCLLLFMTLFVAALSGCTVSHPGSQTVRIDPWGVRPAHEESNRIMREATGDPSWGDVY